MIPWTAFDGQDYYNSEYRPELTEFHVYHFIPRGPSQLQRGNDSSMLELASERQFAIAQLGTQSRTFELEHTTRIELAIQTLFHHFDSHPSFEFCQPSSPYVEDLVGLTVAESQSLDVPPFEIITGVMEVEARKDASSRNKASKSPSPGLAITDLLNHEPGLAVASRTSATDASDVNFANSLCVLDEKSMIRSTLKYVRAHETVPVRVARSRKPPRWRICPTSKPGSRSGALLRGLEAEHSEKQKAITGDLRRQQFSNG